MRRLLVLALATAVAVGGCGKDDEDASRDLDWDLSRSTSVRQVDVPAAEVGVRRTTEVRPDGSLSIRLPGGETFLAQDYELDRVVLAQEGGLLTEVRVVSKAVDYDAGRSWATDWAEGVGASPAGVDGWIARARDRKVANGSVAGAPLGTRGVRPEIILQQGTDRERPMTFAARLTWR